MAVVFTVLQIGFSFCVQNSSSGIASCRTLCMGRASVVRAFTKARTDSARSSKHNWFAKKILLAVRTHRSNDPTVNPLLRQVLEDARAAHCPKDIINRNLEKSLSSSDCDDFKENVYEFYGHGGVGIVANVLTNNANRVASDLSLVCKKKGLRTAAANSVLFKFESKGRLDIAQRLSEDEAIDLCVHCNVDDFEYSCGESSASILVDVSALAPLRDGMRSKGIEVEASIILVPSSGRIEVSDVDWELNANAIAALEEVQDVDVVYHNMDFKS